MTIKKRQSGNVLFLILLAVGLFAALTYAVSDGNRGGSGTISKEQARLGANEILAYHAGAKRVIDQLQQRGCSENDFGFGHPTVTRTDGTLIPQDSPTVKNSCRFYDSSGGEFSIRTFSSQAIPLTEVIGGLSVIMPGTSRALVGRYKDIGQDGNSELLFNTTNIRKEVCEAINKQLGINDGNPVPITTSGAVVVNYNGVFNNLADFAIGKIGEEGAVGHSAFCSTSSNPNLIGGINYAFWSVLIAR